MCTSPGAYELNHECASMSIHGYKRFISWIKQIHLKPIMLRHNDNTSHRIRNNQREKRTLDFTIHQKHWNFQECQAVFLVLYLHC